MSCEGSEDCETGSDGVDRICLRESEPELDSSEHDKTSSKDSFICSGESENKKLSKKIKFFRNIQEPQSEERNTETLA